MEKELRYVGVVQVHAKSRDALMITTPLLSLTEHEQEKIRLMYENEPEMVVLDERMDTFIHSTETLANARDFAGMSASSSFGYPGAHSD